LIPVWYLGTILLSSTPLATSLRSTSPEPGQTAKEAAEEAEEVTESSSMAEPRPTSSAKPANDDETEKLKHMGEAGTLVEEIPHGRQ